MLKYGFNTAVKQLGHRCSRHRRLDVINGVGVLCAGALRVNYNTNILKHRRRRIIARNHDLIPVGVGR